MGRYQRIRCGYACIYAIGMLRQQMRPENRSGIVIKEGGQKSNITTPHTTIEYSIRTRTLKEAKSIKTRVENCFRGAALATACEVVFKDAYVIPELTFILCLQNCSQIIN